MMNKLKSFSLSIAMLTIVMFFWKCSSSKGLIESPPSTLELVFFQKNVSSLEDQYSNYHIFITMADSSIDLDSVYFKNNAIKLELVNSKKITYVGQFSIESDLKKDIIFSSEPNAEYGNEIPIKQQGIPFKLRNNQCVISYKEESITKYFLVNDVPEK